MQSKFRYESMNNKFQKIMNKRSCEKVVLIECGW